MAKGVYIGVNNVARKVKKGYIGVGNVARKIKKAYIGVGGVARPFWAGGEVVYYGAVDKLYAAVNDHYALSNSKYAIFTGGNTTRANASPGVAAFDASLTKTINSNGLQSYGGGYTKLNDYCIFAGGRYGASSASDITSRGVAIDASLTSTEIWLTRAREGIGSATVGSYAIFHGGYHKGAGSTSAAYYSNVEVFNTSLTRSTKTSANEAPFTGASTPSYAIVASNNAVHYDAATYAYNASLTVISASTIKTVVRETGINFGDYAIFPNNGSASPPIFNNSLTLYTSLMTLSSERTSVAFTVLDEFLIAAGGYDSSLKNTTGRYSTIVDIFDKSFTRKTLSLTTGRADAKAASIGSYALIGGGNYYDGRRVESYNGVEAFTI